MSLEIDALMEQIVAEKREQLDFSKARELEKALFSAPFLILQRELNQRIEGKLFQLSVEKLGEPSAMIALARIQGEISGLRQFWEIAKDLIDNPKSEAVT